MWGIRNLGMLVALPEKELISRIGPKFGPHGDEGVEGERVANHPGHDRSCGILHDAFSSLGMVTD
jgi:hypothetical protein